MVSYQTFEKIFLCILGGRYLTTFETSIVGNEFQLTLVQHCNDGY